ncbi:MAG: acyltransferase [Treponema sp.]|nr:acyltransferase [Treponema sp.]
MDESKNFSWNLISRFRTEIMGIAILFVLIRHCDSFSWGFLQSPIQQLISVFSCGVDIFLFVSGFGLYFSMKKDKSVLRFYKRRFVRIIPEYICIAGISYVVLNALHKAGGWKELLLQLSTVRAAFLEGTNDASHLWYMFFIVSAYVVFPGIYFIGNCGKKIHTAFFIIGSIIPILAELLLFIAVPHFMLMHRLDMHLPRISVFLLGLYYGYRAGEGAVSSKKIVLVLFAFFLVLRLGKIVLMGLSNEVPVGQMFVRIANQCFGLAVMISTGVLMETLEEYRLKIIPAVLRWFGTVSFELYLLHFFLLMIWHALGLHNAWYIYFTVIIPCSCLLAEALLLCKRRIGKLKN